MRTLLLLTTLGAVAAFLSGPALPRHGLSTKRASTSFDHGVRSAKLTLAERPAASTEALSGETIAAKLTSLVRGRPNKEVSDRKTVVITGASSGIGLEAAAQLATKRGWYVIMACRSYSKAALSAQKMGMDPSTYSIMQVDLASLESVRDFVEAFKATGRTLDALICNAAVWYPQDKAPRLTADGYEESVGTNHLAHFLMCQLFVPFMPRGGRILFIGTETANDGIAGKVPPVADLGNLDGMAAGMTYTIDGKEFEPTKAYKESKVCNAIVMRELNKRYGKSRGIIVNAMFPGCIAESPLFRQKRGWFRWLFPLFQKYITKQFVTETEAGRRIASCIADEALGVGGAYWKWNAKSGIDYERKLTDENSTPAANVVRIPSEALDELTSERVWELSCALTGVQVAPDISFDYDGLPEAESKRLSMTVKPVMVRDDLPKADILLKNLRALGNDIKNPAVLTPQLTGQWAEEMAGPKQAAGELLYYWGRRAQCPIIKMNGDATTDPSQLSIEITSGTPRWDEAAAELLTTTLLSKLPKVEASPGILMFDERDCPRISTEYKGNMTGGIDDDLCVKLFPIWPDTGEAFEMLRESVKQHLGPDAWGDYTRSDDIIPQELTASLAKQMDEINKPPEGVDAALFGERGTLKRLVWETVSQGKVRP